MPTKKLTLFITTILSNSRKLMSHDEIELNLTRECEIYFEEEKNKKFSDKALKKILAALTEDKKAKQLIKSSNIYYLFYDKITRIKTKARMNIEAVLDTHINKNPFNKILMLVLARHSKSALIYGYPIPMMTEEASLLYRHSNHIARIEQERVERLATLRCQENEAGVCESTRQILSQCILARGKSKIETGAFHAASPADIISRLETTYNEEYYTRSLVLQWAKKGREKEKAFDEEALTDSRKKFQACFSHSQ